MRGFAQHLPVEIVSHLVGLPEEGRERMLDWSTAGFNVFGAPNERGLADEATASEMGHFVAGIERSDLRPDSWGAQLFEAVDRGEDDARYLPGMLRTYDTLTARFT